MKVNGIIIKILSPADCVKDRLVSYIYFKAPEGLDQAVLVAEKQDVNLASIKNGAKAKVTKIFLKNLLKL